MSYQLATAKVWNGSAWVVAAGGGGQWPKVVDASSQVSVTSSGTAHTKGAWFQLIASTSTASDLLMLTINNSQSGVATESLLDIGVGAAGAETVVISDVVAGEIDNYVVGFRCDIVFPLAVPAGTRIAARLQSVATSRVARVYATTMVSGSTSPASLDTLGAITATSRGTNLPTSNTYVEITASTARSYKAIVMIPAGATNNTPAGTSVYTVGSGAAGSEVAIGTLSVVTNVAEFTTIGSQELPFIRYLDLPAGTRLAVKQSTGVAYRDVILYGVPA